MPSLASLAESTDPLGRKAATVLIDQFGLSGEAEGVGVYVPGRVEVLGRHTDYAGGRTVVIAVDRGFRLAASARKDNVLRVTAAAEASDVQEFAYGQTPEFEPGHWINYVATVARRVSMNFSGAVELRGADIAFISDLPIAAGMSSSSALMVATFLAVRAVNGLEDTAPYRREIHSTIELAEYLGCVENGQSCGSLEGEAGVGTFGGSEDHTAMLCCKPGMFSQFSYAPSVFERDIPFPRELSVVVGSSGVEAVKTGAAMEKYNRASLRARKATEAYNRAAGAECRHLRDVAVAVGPDGADRASELIRRAALPEDRDQDIEGRFRCFFREDQHVIPAVGDALLAGDLGRLGELFDLSHEGARCGLQNQIDETNFLQAAARDLGAVGASAFGGGFGGSVLALVEAAGADGFAEAWHERYAEAHPGPAARAEFFVTHPGRPAEVLAD